MKTIGFAVLFFALFQIGMAQTPTVTWNHTFTFGGVTMPSVLERDETGNLYVSGIAGINSINVAAVSRFSQVGIQQWTITDTAKAFEAEGIATLQDRMVWSTTNGDLIASDTTGIELWRKNVGTYARLLAYGDSLIAIPALSNVRVIVMDKDGNEGREFPVMALSRYLGAAKLVGSSLWIFGGDYDGVGFNAGAFVKKFDLSTGQLLWGYHVVDHLPARGDVDSEGNAYFAASYINSTDPFAFSRFHVVKLDTSGTILWERMWYPHKNYLASYESYTQGAAVSPFLSGRQFVVMGTVQKVDTAEHNGDKSAYMVGLDAATGNTTWARKWEYRPAEIISQIQGGVFTPKGQLIVCGNSYLGDLIGFLMEFNIPGVTLDVKELPYGIPRAYALSQNYPNPFNPSTKIRFELPHATHGKLAVYDVLGREVEILWEGEKAPGTYEAEWNASAFPSGIYFAQIRTPLGSETRKMMLVK